MLWLCLFTSAANTLGLQIDTNLGLSFEGSPTRCQAARHITRHACYVSTPHSVVEKTSVNHVAFLTSLKAHSLCTGSQKQPQE